MNRWDVIVVKEKSETEYTFIGSCGGAFAKKFDPIRTRLMLQSGRTWFGEQELVSGKGKTTIGELIKIGVVAIKIRLIEGDSMINVKNGRLGIHGDTRNNGENTRKRVTSRKWGSHGK